MQLDEYQAAATRTLNAQLSAADCLLDAAAGLAEEAGEVLGLVRKHHMQRRTLQPDRLKEELGDALWCLAMTAHASGLSLQDVAEANLGKLRTRWPDGFTAPPG